MNSGSVVLFQAESYREYLAAVVEVEKSAGRGASLRILAERFGIGLSTFKMVLDGSRNLTVRNVHRISVALNLTAQEREFFECMVMRDQSEDEDVRAHYARKLRTFQISQKSKRFRVSSSAVLQNWFVPAFLVYLLDVEKIQTRGFSDDVLKRASNALGIPCETLQTTFRKLEKDGILKPVADSKYHIVFERVSGALSKQKFLKDVFEEGLQRLSREFDNPHAHFSAHTVSMPSSMVPRFFDEYKALVEKYMGYDLDGGEVEILQVCAQAFPVSFVAAVPSRRSVSHISPALKVFP